MIASDRQAPYVAIYEVPFNFTEFTVDAVAVDTAEQRAPSNGAFVEQSPDVTPPQVVISAPLDGAAFIEGVPIGITGTSTDDARVLRVELSMPAGTFQTFDGPAFNTTFTPAFGFAANDEPTALEITARAFDPTGNEGVRTVALTINPDLPPSIAIIGAPADGSAHIEGTQLDFEVDATDDRPGLTVDLVVNGLVVQSRGQAPFRFAIQSPDPDALVDGAFEVDLRATDSQDQTATTARLSYTAINDDPPEVLIVAPNDGGEFVEGEQFEVRANAVDDLGVTKVQFFVDGRLVGEAFGAPYSVSVQLDSGEDGSSSEIVARAFDTRNQSQSDAIEVVRRDDLVPPVGQLIQPEDGKSFTVGPSDVVFVIDVSETTANPTGEDVDGDGDIDSVLEAEVKAARDLIQILNPDTTQVAIIAMANGATLDGPLTGSLADALDALDVLAARGPGFGTNFQNALRVASDELQGFSARRDATPVVLFMTDGFGGDPEVEIQRAVNGGVIVSPFAIGNAADNNRLQGLAARTGGRFTAVPNAADLDDVLVGSVAFGQSAMRLEIDATDDVAIRVAQWVLTSDNDALDATVQDDRAPFIKLFSLPELDVPTDVNVAAAIADFGGNTVDLGSVDVTVLPAATAPEIVRLKPDIGAEGDNVHIVGRFFYPDSASNTVRFGNSVAVVTGGNKFELDVVVPVGAASGPVTIQAGDDVSEGADFTVDNDADGLSDEAEIAIGLDPRDADTDDDGLDDGDELRVFLTDPLDPDTDDDGMNDAFEVQNNFNPRDGADADGDADGDGLTNLDEQGAGSDPRDSDTDDDGLDDAREVVETQTDPAVADTDEGGRNDGDEVEFDLTDPLDPADDLPQIGFGITLRDASNYIWDVFGDASVGNGTIDSFDGAIDLRIDNVAFPTFGRGATEDAGRELRIGLWRDLANPPALAAGLRVWRKVFVPTDDVFARWLEIFDNPTGADITFTARIQSNLGSNSQTTLVADSSGNNVLRSDDDWFVTDDANDGGADPTLAFAFSGPFARIQPKEIRVLPPSDFIYYDFEITVPAGGRRIVMHFAAQNPNRADALVRAAALSALGGSALSGLSADEQADIVNFFAFADGDTDGLSDDDEVLAGTNPSDPDTDGDGMLDGFEVGNGLDPLDPADAGLDPDGDGVTNADEAANHGDPNDTDTDDDGLTDDAEIAAGSRLDKVDTDDDGLDDAREVNELGTDPANPDTDGDGLDDRAEVEDRQTDPLVADTDNDGLVDGFEAEHGFDPLVDSGEAAQDNDGDGLDNIGEQQAGTDPFDDDVDADNLNDGAEVAAGTDPFDDDTDGGGRKDGDEVLDGTDPLDPEDDNPVINLPLSLADGNGRNYDIQPGAYTAGVRRSTGFFSSTSVWGVGLRPSVNGTLYPNFPQGTIENDGREVRIGPFVVDGNIRAIRKIFVPTNGPFARFLDIVENTSDQPQTVTIQIESTYNSTSNEDGARVYNTSDGDDVFEITDRYAVSDDHDADDGGGWVVTAHVVSGPNGLLRPRSTAQVPELTRALRYAYEFEVPPGERRAIMHFAIQQNTRANAIADAEAIVDLAGVALEGLSVAEREQILNFFAFVDADKDGAADDDEILIGTDPDNPDSDGDGLRDGFEIRYGYDPLAPGDEIRDDDADGLDAIGEQEAGTSPRAADSDGDGVDDGDEVGVHESDPLITDTDRDGLSDGREVNDIGSDPTQVDTDGDGLDDKTEVDTVGTNPLAIDTDGDGLRDKFEVDFGFDPLVPGLANDDADNDGLINLAEDQNATDPFDADTDDDRLEDGAEVGVHGTDPAVADTDGGGRRDGDELHFDDTDPLDGADDFPVVTFPFNLNDVGNYLWDVQSSGYINNGTSDAFDGGLQLNIDGQNFPAQANATTEDDGREVRIGPWERDGGDTLVFRKVYVPDDDTFARFLEIIDNRAGEDITVTVRLFSNLGSNGATNYVETLSGDVGFTRDDDWIVTDDATDAGGYPTVVHVFSGPNADLEPLAVTTSAPPNDLVQFEFQVTVPGGGRAIIMHFAAQNLDRARAGQRGTRLRSVQGSALSGLDALEQADIANFLAYIDSDEDGLPDDDELQLGTNPLDPDTDGDGLTDGFEFDHRFDPLIGGEQALDPDADGLDNAGEQAAGSDPNDPDTDGDGLLDGPEVLTHGSDPRLVDTDGDGLTDAAEVNDHNSDPADADSDDDGLTDDQEVNDYLTNPRLQDTDGDGMRDKFEVDNGFDPRLVGQAGIAFPDADRDGLPDPFELTAGTDPNNPDTDGDGLLDGFEVDAGFDPLLGGEQALDSDGDGLDNLTEQSAGTDPNAVDSDGDGLDDGDELNNLGTDPANADTDNDGINDRQELTDFGTDPTNPDSDDDLQNDGDEIAAGRDPLDPDEDLDGLRDGWEDEYGFDATTPEDAPTLASDDDNDGLDTGAESTAGSSPFDADTDNDGLDDGEEVLDYGTDPTLVDTDGGGRSDFDEVFDDRTDPTDGADDLGTISPPLVLVDGDGYTWDVQRDGSILRGTDSAFDGAAFVSVDDNFLDNFGLAFPEDADREIRFGPERNQGLRVDRKVFVPDDGAFARYLEIYENDTNRPIDARVRIESYAGGFDRSAVVATSDADLALTADDDWVVIDDFPADGYGDGGATFCDAEVDIRSAVGFGVYEGSTAGLNDEAGTCGGDGPETTIAWTAPSDGDWTFDTFGSDYDTVLYLRFDCAPEAEIDCNDDAEDLQSQVTTFVPGGTTILIVVDGYDEEEFGRFILNINAAEGGDGVPLPQDILAAGYGYGLPEPPPVDGYGDGLPAEPPAGYGYGYGYGPPGEPPLPPVDGGAPRHRPRLLEPRRRHRTVGGLRRDAGRHLVHRVHRHHPAGSTPNPDALPRAAGVFGGRGAHSRADQARPRRGARRTDRRRASRHHQLLPAPRHGSGRAR